MASYTAIGGGQTPSMTVNFKMNITTYGPHNGITIYSGIQQGTSAAGFFAAQATPNGTILAAPPSIPAIQEIPSSMRGSMQSVIGGSGRTTLAKGDKLDLSRSRSTSRSRPSSPLIEYGGGRDSPPDEFIEPEKVKLNVFNEPYVQHPTDLLLNDTKTTTTTVEVFRSKVDRDNPVDFFELPPNPLGSDPRSQLIRATGPPYEVVTRSETRFSDRPELGGSTSPLPRVQWGSRQSGIASSPSPGYGSTYYGSLERNPRPVSREIQSRQSWIDERDGAYQTMITRRQIDNHQELKLQQPPSFSPTPSITGKGYRPIPIERAEEQYYEQRRPRPLRHTTSQPNVFNEPIRSLDDSYRYPSSRYSHSYYPDQQPRLRRARSRSETRSDDYYFDRNRPTSGLSNISRADSWSNSVNNIFKLYQTRDCLGNVLYELPKTKAEKAYESLHSSKESLIESVSPRKESKRYDDEMIAAVPTTTTKKPILKNEEIGGTTSGRKSRVEFIEPELTSSSARSLESNLLQTEPSELFLDVPISTPDDFDTPRKSPSFRHWIEQPRTIEPALENYEIPRKPETSYEIPKKFAAPICLESKESVAYIQKAPPKEIRMTESSEKVQISKSTTEELAKYGWISPRFVRSLPMTKPLPSSSSHKSLMEDEWPMPPPELSPKRNEAKTQVLITKVKEINEIPITFASATTTTATSEAQPSTSSLTIETKPNTTVSMSFSESLKAQFSHSPSIVSTSPSPMATSSPKLYISSSSTSAAAAKPPLPPSSSLRRPLITQFDTEPRRVTSTSWFKETSFDDSFNTSPSVSFSAQNPPDPMIVVKAEGTTLRLSNLSMP